MKLLINLSNYYVPPGIEKLEKKLLKILYSIYKCTMHYKYKP